jgi:PAS domain S-box-containing protein
MGVDGEPAVMERAAPGPAPLQPLTVLVIDDNPGDVRLIREMLRGSRTGQHPFGLVCAYCLRTGLRRLEAGGIDVVLLDLWLPDSNGLDTFAAVHAHSPGVPVVVLSGRADETLALAAVQRGAQDYLAKGHVSTDILLRVLGYAVERARWLSAEQAARATLEAAVERLRLATRATRDVIWDWDVATDVVDWSPAIEEIFGYGPVTPGSQLQMSSSWWEERVHPEERGDTVASFRRALELGWADWVAEYRFERADGTYAYVVDHAATARDAAGTPVRVVGAIRDISARRQYLEALRRSDELLRTSLETLTDGFGIYTAVRGPDGCIQDFRVDYVNEAACRFWGVPREEQLGQLLGEMIPRFREAGRLEEFVHLVETGGSAMWAALDIDSLYFGRPFRGVFDVYAAKVGDGFVATWHDVTARIHELRQRERLLAEERERREQLTFLDRTATALMESLDVSVIAQRLAATMVPVLGDIAVVMLGRPGPAENQTFVAHERPEQAASIREILERDTAAQRCLQDIAAHGDIVQWTGLASGEGAPEDNDPPSFSLPKALDADSAFVVPLPARGEECEILIVLRADSRPPATENEVTLARLVALRAALALDNARLYGELQATLAARDALAASITHDLRNPLGMIRLGVQSAGIFLDNTNLSSRQRHVEAQQALKQVDEITRRMDTFVQQLLDVAALDTGASLALNRERTDLVAVVRTAVAAQAVTGRIVDVDAPSTPVIGQWDQVRLERVFDNLLSNAAKYSLNDRPIHVKVLLEPQSEGASALVAIQDHGVGIPSPDLPHVFDRFFRGSNVHGSIAGTGLGLSGAKQIVEQHGGVLSLDSQEGVGTTVTVRLPLRLAQPVRQEEMIAA